MPKGIKGFQPGQSGNPNGRELGSKNTVTLLKEERRAMFEEMVSKRWLETIDKLLETEPKYVADQFIGKAADVIRAEIESKSSLTAEEIAEINAIAFKSLKEKRANG